MDPINVQVDPDGGSKWKVAYTTYEFPNLKDAKASVALVAGGYEVRLTAKGGSHTSQPIPDKPEILSQGYGKENYVVKMKCTTSDLHGYF